MGGDASLGSLLADVLGELGITLDVEAPGSAVPPDVVLAHVERGEAILPLLQRARELTAEGPVIVLVPFADERLVRLALRLGARDCFALGRPLDELRRVLLAHLPRARGADSTPSGGAVPPSRGDDP
nr:DNA-binding response regulator [Myxococcus sp. RHSTA-1-4]